MSTPNGPGAATLASSLTSKIQSDIVDGFFRPGERLRTSVLSQRYDASLVPIREALSRLASTGFVLAEDQRGFRVAGVSEAELLDITDIRIFIEAEALRRSISQGDLEWESGLIAAHHHLKRIKMNPTAGSGLDPEWERAHSRFHGALLSGCQSQTLLGLATTLHNQTSRYRHLSMRRCDAAGHGGAAPRDVAAEHESLLQAALDRNADLAVKLLTAHFTATTALVIQHAIRPIPDEPADTAHSSDSMHVTG